MALAPYWLMPTLCPLPVPTMVKVPLLEAVVFALLPPVVTDAWDTPAAVIMLTVSPLSRETFPLPEITDRPSSPERVWLPLTVMPEPVEGPPPLMPNRRLGTDLP